MPEDDVSMTGQVTDTYVKVTMTATDAELAAWAARRLAAEIIGRSHNDKAIALEERLHALARRLDALAQEG